jgi:prolyl-tRNA synthetase
MLWSKLFIPTLRESPAEATTVSRQLLMRAGYLRGASGYLFLARRALRRIVGIIREEMDEAGAQEMLLPDEGAFDAVARELRSYKQLPQLWYRFADAMDARSYRLDEQRLDGIARRILERCGLEFTAADGSFAVISDAGETLLARCIGCGYSARMDVAETVAAMPAVDDPDGDRTPEPFHTPGRKTIADVAEFTGLPETSQMKSLVLVAAGKPVLVMVRGDHQLSPEKFAAATGDAHFRPARPDEIFEWFGAQTGSLGPVGAPNMRILADLALRGRRNMIAGANRDDYHLRYVTPDEDFEPEWHDLRQACPGDNCARCGGMIEGVQAIELARAPRPRLAAELRVTNAAGQEVAPFAAVLKVHVDRVLQAAVQLFQDKDGIVMPPAIAPFDVVITPVNVLDAALREGAEAIYRECLAAGLDALLDDRDERPGVKFKDADLIGVPWRINVGKKLAGGMVELVERKTRRTVEVAAAGAAAAVKREVTAAPDAAETA